MVLETTPEGSACPGRTLRQWSPAARTKRPHSPCFGMELEYESNEVLEQLELAHDDFVVLIRYYRRVVNTDPVREELKALSMIFFDQDAECNICESGAGIERTGCWDVIDGEEGNEQYNAYIDEVFGHADDAPERCRSMEEMHKVCAGPALPVLVALLLRVHRLSTRHSTRKNLTVSNKVRGMAEGFTEQVRNVQFLNRRLARIQQHTASHAREWSEANDDLG